MVDISCKCSKQGLSTPHVADCKKPDTAASALIFTYIRKSREGTTDLIEEVFRRSGFIPADLKNWTLRFPVDRTLIKQATIPTIDTFSPLLAISSLYQSLP